MEIREIDVQSFAGLSDLRWRPHPGLTFIYGPNESGKSTLVAFIKAMFYGLGRRHPNPDKNARLLYTPWHSRRPMQGSIHFNLGGEDLRLERVFGHQEAEDRVRLYSLSRSREIPLKRPARPGQELLQLSVKEFDQLCLMQDPYADRNFASLDDKIRRLRESGREDFSWQDALKQLKTEAKSLSPDHPEGKLYAIRQKKRQLQVQLTAAQDRDQARDRLAQEAGWLSAELAAIEGKLDYIQTSDQLAAAQESLDRWQLYQTKVVCQGVNQPVKAVPVRDLAGLSQQSYQIDYRQDQLAQLLQDKAKLTSKERELSMKYHAVCQQQLALDRQKSAAPEGKPFFTPPPAATTGSTLPVTLLSVLVVLLLLIILQANTRPWLFFLLILPFSVAYLLQRRQDRMQSEYQEQWQRWQADQARWSRCEETYRKNAWQQQRLAQELQALTEQEHHLDYLIKTAEQDIQGAKNSLMLALKSLLGYYPEQVDPQQLLEKVRKFSLEREEETVWLEKRWPDLMTADPAVLQAEAQKARQIMAQVQADRQVLVERGWQAEAGEASNLYARQLFLREKLAVNRVEVRRLNTLPVDTANLEHRLDDMGEAEQQAEELWQINQVAQSLLVISGETYRADVRPEIDQRANRYLETFTRGQYHWLEIGQEGQVTLADATTGAFREDAFYSSGTKSLIWLALRLALADLVFDRSGETVPLLLDDSLLYLDYGRLDATLRALDQYARRHKRQILFFSRSDKALDLVVRQKLPILRLQALRDRRANG